MHSISENFGENRPVSEASLINLSSICDRIWEKGPYCAKCDFLQLFKLPPFQGLKSPRLPTCFVGSLGLLRHRSNVRSYSKPPVPSSEMPKWGIKWRFSNAIDTRARPAHTGSGRGSQRVVSIAGWWKNIHAKFEVHSYYGFRDINIWICKFGKCTIRSLFSYPTTYQPTLPWWGEGSLGSKSMTLQFPHLAPDHGIQKASQTQLESFMMLRKPSESRPSESCLSMACLLSNASWVMNSCAIICLLATYDDHPIALHQLLIRER